MLTTAELYDFGHTLAGEYLSRYTYPWEALKGIKDFILALGETLDKGEYTEISPSVWVHKTVKIAPTAYLGAPCIIGAGTEVRHCAFIRGSALVGENCVVGHSVELKNVILFDNVQTPHYNYVGDSILGYKSHMGAGSITSNVKSDKTPVTEKNGGDVGRFCRSRLQQRSQSGNHHRAEHEHLSAVLCPRGRACGFNLENRRCNGKEKIRLI